MRRGLIAWNKAELPDAVFDARIERTRAAMAAAGLDALLLYTNNTRTAAVSWLTGFVPYWSEGLAIIPRTGAPVLVVALSNRVRRWIESVSRVERVIPAPRIGLEAAKQIAEGKPSGSVGIVEFDTLRADIAGDLAKAGPGLKLSDATELFAKLRATADPAEVALTAKAGWIAQQALAAVPVPADTIGAAIAAAESRARLLGAEEIYVAAAPDLCRDRRLVKIEANATVPGPRFALRATVAYKGNWARLTRTFFRDATAAPAAIAEQFAAAVATLPDGSGFKRLPSWLVEGCRAAQPLDPLLGSMVSEPVAPASGAVVSVQATYVVDGQPVLIAAPALIGGPGRPTSLLVHPAFED
jgi:hypothetical protein